MITAVGVVVPARDEEALLPACLAALKAAAADPSLAHVRVHLVVVLDDCTDGSAQVVEAAGVDAVVATAGNVGIARAMGVTEVLGREAGTAPEELWLAMTDADTTVPAHWLATQVRLADGGADVVVGTVEVEDWSEHPPIVAQRYGSLYRSGLTGDEHAHVHGANLGLRASVYGTAGGLAALALAEDHALVAACAATGARIVRTLSLPVSTSARRSARAVGGFADLLLSLAGRPLVGPSATPEIT